MLILSHLWCIFITNLYMICLEFNMVKIILLMFIGAVIFTGYVAHTDSETHKQQQMLQIIRDANQSMTVAQSHP